MSLFCKQSIIIFKHSYSKFLLIQGCCNYGSDGANTKAYDCVNIPGAKKVPGTVIVNNFCGGNLITDAAITGAEKTVCCKFLDSRIKKALTS